MMQDEANRKEQGKKQIAGRLWSNLCCSENAALFFIPPLPESQWAKEGASNI